MFEEIEKMNTRPKPFEFYTARDLWADEHTSNQMLVFHLNEEIDVSSRNAVFIDRSVEWIISHFNIGMDTKIADFGCGPGLYASRLARSQAAVTGVDFSKRSIDYAREVAGSEGLNINYVNQDYLDFETDEKFQLIMMIMCDFCALSPMQRRQMLSKFHAMLETGGSILLDVYSLATFNNKEESATYQLNSLNGFWSPNKYYGFLNTFKYDEEKVILDKFSIVEESRIRTVYNWLQCFTPDTLGEELAESGFSVESIYADVAGSEYDPDYTEFAIVAKKK
ncbi:class I SAM-dependent methyltransferase [Candidatus Neomarinimicrobiota bacterium]